jgi:hypothetical protein
VKINFVAVDLGRWDQAPAGELLAVGFYTDLRPLRGAAGLVDWRFDGRISALILGGNLSGAEGEQLLMPNHRRLPWRWTLALGLGPSADFDDERASRAVRKMLQTMRGLALAKLAVALPGREIERIPARRALQVFLKEAEAAPAGSITEVTLVETAAGQKDLGEVLRRRGQPTRAREPRARGASS